jgi:NADH-quinone oxidoreductase subunit L
MTRQVALVWFGRPRWEGAPQTPVSASTATGAGGHGGHDEAEPHESPWTMTLPLVVLSIGAIFGGLLNLPYWRFDVLTRWLAPVLPATIAPDPHVATGVKVILAVLTTALCIGGVVLGFIPWLRSAEHPALEPAVLQHAWYYDDAVSAFMGGPATEGADFAAYTVDKGVIDGAVNGVAALTAVVGRGLRKLQTGYVRNYALGVAGGAAVILLYVAIRGGG